MVCAVAKSKMNTDESDITELEGININLTDDDYDPVDLNNTNGSEMCSEDDDPLKLVKIAGGNITHHPPLFSPDSELLFVVCGDVVQIYSTTTGKWLRNLEGPNNEIVSLQYEINNERILIACTKTGEIYRWDWESGNVENNYQILLKGEIIETFTLIDVSQRNPCAFVTHRPIKRENIGKTQNNRVQWNLINLKTGSIVNCPLNLKLGSKRTLAAADTKHFHYLVVIQDNKMFVIDYKNWKFIFRKSPNNVPFTFVKCHPTEEAIATGDSNGRVFLWREIWCHWEQPKTTLYHWHHTAITSLDFTSIGSGFYSGGLEAVLVKWLIDKPYMRNFLPRIPGPISHVVVSSENDKIAVCTNDNGIQIVDDQMKLKCVLQNFTHVFDDKTGSNNFPVGLRLNPRSNCLVTNGRVGHLQFFSTYTKNLLYNMDVVNQNRLSLETGKILYDIQVTKAAFNIDWIATGEVWNDKEHASELRLKFWEFKKESQNFALNTNVELPHEGGFKAIEFSDLNQSENLYCVTVGNENVIKVWSLEDSDNIYKKGKVWYCVGKTNFKNMPIESVSFSLDGSVLAAGFGNCLCLYKTDNLKLKAVLTAPGSYDGIVKKIQIQVPEKIIKSSKNGNNSSNNYTKDKKKRMLELLHDFIDNNQQEILTQIKNSSKIIKGQKFNAEELDEIDFKNMSRENFTNNLYKKILPLAELNLFQKLSILQKLEIFCDVANHMKQKILNYIATTIVKAQNQEINIQKKFFTVEKKQKFKAKYRLHKYFNQKSNQNSVDDIVSNKLIPLLKLINVNKIKEGRSDLKMLNGFYDQKASTLPNNMMSMDTQTSLVQSTSCIQHVVFGTGEFAHLVIACTEYRVLIWNILTLKLQSVLKLSTREITVDPLTGLCAVFTKNNELFVFPPNTPMCVYQRRDLPVVKGACWVPRRQSKLQSISLDWQSLSTVYFLTDKQELMYLASDNDTDDNLVSKLTQLNAEHQKLVQYTTFGTQVIKKNNPQKIINPTTASIEVPGKSIKTLISLPTNAMPSANVLSHSFMKSLIGADDKPRLESNDDEKFSKENSSNDDEYDDTDDDNSIEKRRKTQQEITNKVKLLKNHNNLTNNKKNEELLEIYHKKDLDCFHF